MALHCNSGGYTLCTPTLTHISIYPSIYLDLSIYLSIYSSRSIYLYIYLSIYLSIDRSIYLYIIIYNFFCIAPV